MLPKARRLAILSAASACLLAGCQPAVVPTPAPSFRCTPEAGGAEFDCTPQQHDDMVAKDKLYAEAEAVYRKFHEEDERIYRAGGVSEPSEALLATTTGDFLDESMEIYRALKKSGTKVVGGEMSLVSLDRVPGAATGDSVVALRSCVDGTSASLYENGSLAGKGTAGSDLLFFVPTGGVLKIQAAEGKEVTSC